MANSLLAKINGNNHRVVLRTAEPEFIPKEMTIELAGNTGYGSRGREGSSATNITLDNETQTKVILFPGATGNKVTSRGTVTDEGESDNHIIQQ